MELNHLRHFYIVAREKGFTRASKVMRLQQPAISKTIKTLEESLGVRLLDRHARGVSLTTAGEEVYERCRLIFSTVQDLESFSQKQKVECSGPLRFGASDAITSYLIPQTLKPYLKEHPKVRPIFFTGTSGAICDELRQNRIEFGLFFTVPEDRSLEIESLGQIPFALVVSSKAMKALPDLSRCFIGSREVDYPKGRSFPVMEMLKARGLKPEVLISSNHCDSHRRMVLEGLGFALLPEFMVREDLERGRMTQILPEKKFSYGLRLAMRKKKALSRNAQSFISIFRDCLRTQL